MNTERRARGAEAGFTLIEILVAMVILAVGMMALQALGIGAARSISHADQQSELTMVATRHMEERILEVHRAPTTVSTAERCAADAGYYVCTQVLTAAQQATIPSDAARVRVWIRDDAQGPIRLDLVSHVYDADLP